MKKIIGCILMFAGFAKIASAQANPDVFTYKVGAFELTLLSEGQQNAGPGNLIGTTPEMLRKYAPDGTFPNATNAFLLRTPEKTILIDAGYGRRLFDNLQSLGVTADGIDAILITHMHGDHIGGLLRDGKPAFPHAEMYLARREHDFWMNGDNARGGNTRAVIAAYKAVLRLFQPTEPGAKTDNLLSGVSAVAAFGHTPGHTMFMIESGNEKILVWGDLTHAMAIQMPCPAVAMTYDTDPKQAVASREKVLEYVSKNNIPVAGMHIAYPAMGRVTKAKAPEAYIFTPFTK